MLREFDKYRKDGYIDLNQLDTETEEKNLPPNIHFSFNKKTYAKSTFLPIVAQGTKEV